MEAINLNRLAYFAAVVDAGSFTRAAERLGVTKTVVSQQVAKLEAELKTSLLMRTTRRVEPTEAGRLLHGRCVMILREAEDAFGELAEANAEPQGVLRVGAPHDYGVSMIAPLAAAFSQKHSGCSVEILLSDERTDLIANQIDVSIRIGWLEDSTLQARRICAFHQYLVAVPALAAGISTLDQVGVARFVANTALREPLAWRFGRGDGDPVTLRMRPAVSANSTPAVLAATIAGAGLAVLPDFLVGAALTAGTLVQVLPEWELPSGGIHAVYPAARFRPPKVTAFITMLVEETRRLEQNAFR